MDSIVKKIKEKKEFSGLPDSIVENVIKDLSSSRYSEEFLVKEVRNKLRKYFGVFLTNKVVKPKDIMDYDSVLNSHISSKKRNYNELYKFIFNICEDAEFIFDFGCGVNGFSLNYINKYLSNFKYIGFEASKQLVDNLNFFFKKNNYDAFCNWCDILNLEYIEENINLQRRKIFFCFQIIDALDKLEKHFSFKFLNMLKKNMLENDKIVLSFPIESLSGKQNFKDSRKDLFLFIENNFDILADKKFFGERFLILCKSL